MHGPSGVLIDVRLPDRRGADVDPYRTCRAIACFNSSNFRGFGRPANNARWMSSEEYRPTLRTTTFWPSCSHSMTDPGPIPSLRRISAGTEIWPRAVTFDCGRNMRPYCHGKAFKHGSHPTALPRRQLYSSPAVRARSAQHDEHSDAFRVSLSRTHHGSGIIQLVCPCSLTWRS